MIKSITPGPITVATDKWGTYHLRGTRIRISRGQVCVEDLRIGDEVITRLGGLQPIKWIGRQSYGSRFIQNNPDKFPVCIHAGALGNELPDRDLYVSPGHSMMLNGTLVPARALINGLTITQDRAPPEVHCFSIELESHDCVIAEGSWSETYADGPGLRDIFHNLAEFHELYPDDVVPAELSLCADRPESGAALDAALRPVVLQAAASVSPGLLQGYIDYTDGQRHLCGWAQDTAHPDLPVLLEVSVGERVLGTVLACDPRDDLRQAGFGRGRCAFSFEAAEDLSPEQLARLSIRRVSDGSALRPTALFTASIGGVDPARRMG